MSFAPIGTYSGTHTGGNGKGGGIRSTEQSCNSPPLGTTPAFEPSAKSNNTGMNPNDQRAFGSIAVLENAGAPDQVSKFASTQR